MIQSEEFLNRLLGPLLKTGLLFMENVIKPLSKSVLIPLRLAAETSTADAGIHKKIIESGKCSLDLALPHRPSDSASHNTTLITFSDEIEDIIKMVKSLEDSSLVLKRVSETIQNEAKE